MTQHTPGPWNNPGEGPFRISKFELAKPGQLATFDPSISNPNGNLAELRIINDGGEIIASFRYSVDDTPEEIERVWQYARLYAAAPELLAFAEGVAKCDMGANAQFNLVIENARELVAKARGEVSQ